MRDRRSFEAVPGRRHITARRAPTRLAAAACIALGAASSAVASAQDPASAVDSHASTPPAAATAAVSDLPGRRFAINDDDPVSSVPSPKEANRAPLDMGYWVMAVTDRAEGAVKRDDHAHAAKYYAALAAAVPERALAFSKLCRSLELSGQREQALTACRSALGKTGVTVDDHARYVRLVVTGDGAMTQTQLADVDAIIEQLERGLDEQNAPVLANQLQCELGLRLHDRARLDRCVGALAKLAPEDPRTLAFDFARRLQAGDLDAAEQLITRARAHGVPSKAIAEMTATLRVERDRAPGLRAALRGWLAPALAAAAVFVLVFLLMGWRTRNPRAA